MLKVVAWVVAVVVVLAGGLFVWSKLSPWPAVLVIRHNFEQGAEAATAEMAKHVPDDIATVAAVHYDPADPVAFLDVYYPATLDGTGRTWPTIVWVHGGAWISGKRANVANYAKILAGHGYTTVALDYTIAPEAQYPTPLRQVNAALGYLKDNAEALHIDASRFIIAGDSAGAQIAAQVANLISVRSYATDIGIEPAIERERLAAVLLFCGAYDIGAVNLDGSFGGFLRTVMWAYSGTRDFLDLESFRTASVINYVTEAFPPAFITAGNADPLEPQSVAFADALEAKGVRVETLFYPKDFAPPLGHEYQFHLDGTPAQGALERTLAFLAAEVPRD